MNPRNYDLMTKFLRKLWQQKKMSLEMDFVGLSSYQNYDLIFRSNLLDFFQARSDENLLQFFIHNHSRFLPN